MCSRGNTSFRKAFFRFSPAVCPCHTSCSHQWCWPTNVCGLRLAICILQPVRRCCGGDLDAVDDINRNHHTCKFLRGHCHTCHRVIRVKHLCPRSKGLISPSFARYYDLGLRKDSKGGSNPESLSPASMSCVRTEDNDVFVAEDRAFQKLVGKRS